MSLCYSNQKKFDEAHNYIEMSIALASAQQPLNHDIMATCHHVYPVYYKSTKQYTQAYEQARLSLGYAKQILLCECSSFLLFLFQHSAVATSNLNKTHKLCHTVIFLDASHLFMEYSFR